MITLAKFPSAIEITINTSIIPNIVARGWIYKLVSNLEYNKDMYLFQTKIAKF